LDYFSAVIIYSSEVMKRFFFGNISFMYALIKLEEVPMDVKVINAKLKKYIILYCHNELPGVHGQHFYDVDAVTMEKIF
jgi:hypothetical protein